MKTQKSFKIILLAVMSVGLGACQTSQSTSGKSYVDKYKNVPVSGSKAERGTVGIFNIDEKVREVAAVEPILKFPGRYGIAKIEHGRLTPIPEEEMKVWLKVKDNQGHNFGEFIPVSPMVADMTSELAGLDKSSKDSLINEIRLGAARQHLDAVLVYEAYSKAKSKDNLLKVGDLTIIGHYLLPSEHVSSVGYANAMLIDVVQGYPYGSVSVTGDEQSGFSTSANRGENRISFAKKARTDAVAALAPEVDDMLTNLRLSLAGRG